MKKYYFLLFIIIYIVYNSFSAQNKYFDNDRIYFKTPINIQLPILIVHNQLFLDSLDSVILRRDFHSRGLFKNKIYNIDIKYDSINNGYFIYISLSDSAILASSKTIGIFERNGALLKLAGKGIDPIFEISNNYKSYTILRPDCKDDYVTIEYCWEPVIKDYPAWLFYLSDNELKLIFTQFLPEKDDFFLDYYK